MKISTNTDFFPAPEAAGDAIRLTHDAGFDCFDLSLFGMKADDHPFNAPGYEKHARELRHIANECGIVCNQSHAPFPSSYPDTTPEWIAANRTIPDKLRRAMEIAAIVGPRGGGEYVADEPLRQEHCRFHLRQPVGVPLLHGNA